MMVDCPTEAVTRVLQRLLANLDDLARVLETRLQELHPFILSDYDGFRSTVAKRRVFIRWTQGWKRATWIGGRRSGTSLSGSEIGYIQWPDGWLGYQRRRGLRAKVHEFGQQRRSDQSIPDRFKKGCVRRKGQQDVLSTKDQDLETVVDPLPRGKREEYGTCLREESLHVWMNRQAVTLPEDQECLPETQLCQQNSRLGKRAAYKILLKNHSPL
jgi:hypothetical protein